MLKNVLEHYWPLAFCPLNTKVLDFLNDTSFVVATFDKLVRKPHDSLGKFEAFFEHLGKAAQFRGDERILICEISVNMRKVTER